MLLSGTHLLTAICNLNSSTLLVMDLMLERNILRGGGCFFSYASSHAFASFVYISSLACRWKEPTTESLEFLLCPPECRESGDSSLHSIIPNSEGPDHCKWTLLNVY